MLNGQAFYGVTFHRKDLLEGDLEIEAMRK